MAGARSSGGARGGRGGRGRGRAARGRGSAEGGAVRQDWQPVGQRDAAASAAGHEEGSAETASSSGPTPDTGAADACGGAVLRCKGACGGAVAAAAKTSPAAAPRRAAFLFSDLELPEDVSRNIFSRLVRPRDVAQACLVSRTWQRSVRASVVELDFSEVMDLNVGKVLAVLPSFPALARLVLAARIRLNGRYLGFAQDMLLSSIAAACPRLTSLHAVGYPHQDYEFLESDIRELLRLRPGLRHLALGTSISADITLPGPLLSTLPQVAPALRSLELFKCTLPAPTDIPAAAFASLDELSLEECVFPLPPTSLERTAEAAVMTDVFALLAQLTGLRRLRLGITTFCARHAPWFSTREGAAEQERGRIWLSRLSTLTSLTSLRLCGVQGATAIPASWAKGLSGLTSLSLLRMPDLTTLDPVFSMTQLRELALSHLPGRFQNGICRLTSLTRLAYSNTIGSFIPLHLSSLTGLTELDLTAMRGTMQQLSENDVAGLTGITTLRLARCRNLVSLRSLGQLQRLELLDIAKCRWDLGETLPQQLQTRRREGLLKVVERAEPLSVPTMSSHLHPVLQRNPDNRFRLTEFSDDEHGEEDLTFSDDEFDDMDAEVSDWLVASDDNYELSWDRHGGDSDYFDDDDDDDYMSGSFIL